MKNHLLRKHREETGTKTQNKYGNKIIMDVRNKLLHCPHLTPRLLRTRRMIQL